MTDNYTVCDGDDNAITRGLQAHDVEHWAQRIADERGETVWYSRDRRPDEDPDEYEAEMVAVHPSGQRTEGRIRALCMAFEDHPIAADGHGALRTIVELALREDPDATEADIAEIIEQAEADARAQQD